METLLEAYDSAIVLDTETTGLVPEEDRIIEFAAIKIEKNCGIVEEIDDFIRLPEGMKIPPFIEKLTNISDKTLDDFGVQEEALADRIAQLIPENEHTLLIAYNAHFDLRFIEELLARHSIDILNKCDFLDALTVYKDRAEYPHKLEDAIAHYELEDEVQNTHRAIDDVKALYYVLLSMADESLEVELSKYINIFGYNPKYKLDNKLIKGVRYIPQPYSNFKRGIKLPFK